MLMTVHLPLCLLTDQHVGRYEKPRSQGLIRNDFFKAQFRSAVISLSGDTYFIWYIREHRVHVKFLS